MNFLADLLVGAFGYGMPNVQRTHEAQDQKRERRRSLSITERRYLSAVEEGNDAGAEQLRDQLASDLREFNEGRAESDGEQPIPLGQYLDSLHRVIAADRQEDAQLRAANALPSWGPIQLSEPDPRVALARGGRSAKRGLLASQLRNQRQR